MKILTVVTEQYTKAFGHTVPEVDLSGCHVFEKTRFSMMTPDVKNLAHERSVKSVVLCGIEAHVCVLQTALELRAEGIDVHVLVDGIGSQRDDDMRIALQRMQQSGVFLTTFERSLMC